MSAYKRTEDGFGAPKDKLEFASIEALKTLIAGASDKDGAVHALTLFNLVAATTITAIESIAAGTKRPMSECLDAFTLRLQQMADLSTTPSVSGLEDEDLRKSRPH